MDLVKTILVYMTILLSGSAQLQPQLTPLPAGYISPPAAIVSQAPVEQAGQTQQQTPAPVSSPSPTPQLTTLYVGDRGENVRMLQTRLKELGYLDGKVDGVFGQQTLKAVEAFQKANKLKVDGIPGPATLQLLYFDQSVVWAKTPEPQQAVEAATEVPQQRTATLPILYLSTDGTLLFGDLVTLSMGRTTLRASEARVPAGYLLTGQDQVTVTVDEQGQADHAQVIFSYYPLAEAQQPASATVQVSYLDEAGAALNQQQLQLSPGTSRVYALDQLLPPGYVLTSPREARVSVDMAGQATPDSLSFSYQKAPVYALVPVDYVDSSGIRLFQDQLSLAAGSHSVQANLGRVQDGYIPLSQTSYQVVVDQAGKAEPASLTFVYKKPVFASVMVQYSDQDGNILHQQSHRFFPGSHRIPAEPARLAQGTQLQGLGYVELQVDDKGSAKPDLIQFVFDVPGSPATEPASTGAGEQQGKAGAQAALEATEAPPTSAEPTETETASPAPLEGFFGPALPVSFAAGDFPVYTGPGEDYYLRPGARVDGGQGQAFGTEGGFVLVAYPDAQGLMRYGYVKPEAIADAPALEALQLDEFVNTLYEAAFLWDSLDVDLEPLGSLGEETPFVLLASHGDSELIYVEAFDFIDGLPVRGFILASLLP